MSNPNLAGRDALKKRPANEPSSAKEARTPSGGTIRDGTRGPVGQDMVAWREELAFFKRTRSGLLQDDRYAGRYVAISKKQVIDSDADNFVLARRIHRQHPAEVVLITKVEDAERVVELPSPELAR
jgi:hypothetical protein